MALLKELYEARMQRALEQYGSTTYSSPSLRAANLGALHLAELPGLGLGSTTWDGAKVLADALPGLLRDEAHADPRDTRRGVLELGAGTGLAGIAAALLIAPPPPAPRVLLTDKEGELAALRRTVALNRPQLQQLRPACACEVRALSWGDDAAVAAAVDWLGKAGEGEGGGDEAEEDTGGLLVLGADVVYRDDLVAPLVATLSALLPRPTGGGDDGDGDDDQGSRGRSSSSTGRFLMAYRERGAGEAFFAAMDDAGFEGTLLLSNSTDAEPPTCGGAVADSSVAWTMENVREEAKKAASEPRHFYSAQRHSVLQFRRRRPDAPVVSGHLLG